MKKQNKKKNWKIKSRKKPANWIRCQLKIILARQLQSRETYLHICTYLHTTETHLFNFDLTSNILYAFYSLDMLLPQIGAAQRFPPTLLALLQYDILQLYDQTTQNIQMLLAVIDW